MISNNYKDIITRFLNPSERLILSKEKEMPLVIEAKINRDLPFLHQFLHTHSEDILKNISEYGAVLLRGFDITNEEDFEKTILSIQGLQGISEAFMSEEGRTHVNNLKYVLHTNAIYKTGGTLYLGGFHSENYYSPDVPSFISFCCLEPSKYGGETGLVHSGKIYSNLSPRLKEALSKKSFFVSKWLISEVANRYKVSPDLITKICQDYNLPTVGVDENKFILMYKPNVLTHPVNKKNTLQINLFEVPNLNTELRKRFTKDYSGDNWFWHRLVWKFPRFVFTSLEFLYIIFASLIYSPREAIETAKTKYRTYRASKKVAGQFDNTRVGSCFQAKDVELLAELIRNYYCSCIWKKGDILIVDNRQVMHAGMPGKGERIIRAMICNPIKLNYSLKDPGLIKLVEERNKTIGSDLKSI